MTGRLVLVRHGQSHGNVERRLDTRPPGAALTDLGHQQARAFAANWSHPVGIIAHSVATRARETAAGIAAGLHLPTLELEGIHEVQVGDLENRNDQAAIDEFEAVYRRWHEGELDVPVPGGETGRQVLDRAVPVLTELRVRHLDDRRRSDDIVVVSHGAAIRLVSAVLAGVDSSYAFDNHLSNTECVVLSPITDGRWSCVQWGEATPPFTVEVQPEPQTAEADAGPMG
ncbi:histidine phosphatase family protein [Mycolicibacterium bacteremicum]|uniref:Histidine phosphatase family protein n=1 Tax=Mycolicibacterium bacteremicum TaxID=564198 RepID=A0A1W9YT17_MYCBA|nr:histidine phosphatase family protein [Mycolicibacterium bacteremicum]MCV7430033.1 histidine phosphatase family protein [Mycolicibacterium bacteremicum]ORA03206.1 histidine phosphatase family protein [Mycolicibacterium bacteremicum]